MLFTLFTVLPFAQMWKAGVRETEVSHHDSGATLHSPSLCPPHIIRQWPVSLVNVLDEAASIIDVINRDPGVHIVLCDNWKVSMRQFCIPRYGGCLEEKLCGKGLSCELKKPVCFVLFCFLNRIPFLLKGITDRQNVVTQTYVFGRIFL